MLRRLPLLAAVPGLFVACATASLDVKEDAALRDLLWTAATECARNSPTITVTDVDAYGRVHYTLWQGGKQDVPAWEACYQEKTRQAFADRPDLAEYARNRSKPLTP